MSSQLPSDVTLYINGRERQSPSNNTAMNIDDDAKARLAQPTRINGIANFMIINPDIVNGEKTVIKCRVHMGSNELILAIFPVPKNDNKIYNIYIKFSKGKFNLHAQDLI